MNKVMVTGAGGFVGQHLVRALVKKDYEVYATTFSDSSELAELLPTNHLLRGDLTDHTYVKKLLTTSKPDIIFHLAALSVVHNDVPRARRALENNLGLQYNLLEEVRQLTPDTRFVAICSGNVYGKVEESELPLNESSPIRPLNAYSVSKLSQELLAKQYYFAHNLDVVILRPFNHTGPGQTKQFVIPAFARQFALIKSGQQDPVIKVGNLDTARDFTDVEDMVSAYILAANKCPSGEVYNLGSGQASKISQILTLMSEISGIKVEIKQDPQRVRGVDVPVLVADSSKFQQATGWKPTISFRQTLTKVLKYWEEQI
jgi:GDP-4-dehydro-6-deoxy-D-mannose reductase